MIGTPLCGGTGGHRTVRTCEKEMIRMDGKLFAVILVTAGLFAGLRYLVSLVCRSVLRTAPQTGCPAYGYGSDRYRSSPKNAGAYAEMLRMLRSAVRGKCVLELAAGSGMLAPHVVHSAKMIEAVDSSESRLEAPERENTSAKLHYSVHDMTHLPYADETFDAVILFDVQHSTGEPEKVLAEAKRVLTGNGSLLLPAVADGGRGGASEAAAAYFRFLQENGLLLRKSVIWSGAGPLAYAECGKSGTKEEALL